MTMMHESEFNQRCHDYFDGAMSPEEVQQFLKSVSENPDLQAIYNGYVEVHRQLQAIPPESPPEGLQESILQALAQERIQQAPKTKTMKQRVGVRMAAAVVLVAVSVTAWMVLSIPHADGPLLAENPQTRPQIAHHTVTHTVSKGQKGGSQTDEDALLAKQMESAWSGLDELGSEQDKMLEETNWPTSTF